MNEFPLDLIVIMVVVGLIGCAMVFAGHWLKADFVQDPWPEESWQRSMYSDDDR